MQSSGCLLIVIGVAVSLIPVTEASSPESRISTSIDFREPPTVTVDIDAIFFGSDATALRSAGDLDGNGEVSPAEQFELNSIIRKALGRSQAAFWKDLKIENQTSQLATISRYRFIGLEGKVNSSDPAALSIGFSLKFSGFGSGTSTVEFFDSGTVPLINQSTARPSLRIVVPKEARIEWDSATPIAGESDSREGKVFSILPSPSSRTLAFKLSVSDDHHAAPAGKPLPALATSVMMVRLLAGRRRPMREN